MAADNARRNQLSDILKGLFAGGARGGDPYQNEKSGPFASSPRVYGGGGGAPASRPGSAGPTPAGGKVPVPATRPTTAAAGKGGRKKAATGPNNMPIPVPLPRPLQSAPQPYGGPMAAADAATANRPQLWQDQPYPGASPATGNTEPDLSIHQAAGGAPASPPFMPPVPPHSLTPPQGPFPTVAQDQGAGYMPRRPASPTSAALPFYPGSPPPATGNTYPPKRPFNARQPPPDPAVISQILQSLGVGG